MAQVQPTVVSTAPAAAPAAPTQAPPAAPASLYVGELGKNFFSSTLLYLVLSFVVPYSSPTELHSNNILIHGRTFCH